MSQGTDLRMGCVLHMGGFDAHRGVLMHMGGLCARGVLRIGMMINGEIAEGRYFTPTTQVHFASML